MASNKNKSEETKLEVVQPSALVEYDYGDDDGSGFGQQSKDDYSIPFVILLQALTPSVVDRVHPAALSGNMYNTITERYYDRDQGFLFVPATTQHKFCKWVPRDEGGGFRGHLEPEDPIVLEAEKNAEKFGKLRAKIGEEDLQLTETFYVYGAVCDEEGNAEGMALIAFTSTKIAAYKRWMTRMRDLRIPRPGKEPVKPPMWANLCRITAKSEKNSVGQYFVFAIKPGDPRGMRESLLRPDDQRYLLAKGCAELVTAGKARVEFDKQGEAGEESGGKKIPF